jgi:hypothetical protein
MLRQTTKETEKEVIILERRLVAYKPEPLQILIAVSRLNRFVCFLAKQALLPRSKKT